MRTEHVQGWQPEAWDEHLAAADEDGNILDEWTRRRERPRPVHAVLAVMEDDGTDLILEERTVCGRVATVDLEPTLPLAPFTNSIGEDRCTWCEQTLLTVRVGQPGIPHRTVG